MTARFYFDIQVPGMSNPPGNTSTVRLSQVVKILHGGIKNLSDRHVFAIDLPNYNRRNRLSVIRVFASTDTALNELSDVTRSFLGRIGVDIDSMVVREVPHDFRGPWHICKRFRISSRKSFSKSLAKKDSRLSRMQIAQERNLPYFPMTSSSNKNGFRLYFERIPVEDVDESASWSADGYGLSNTVKVAVLPSL